MQFSRGSMAILGIAAIGVLAIGLFLGPFRPSDESMRSPTPAASPSVTAAASPRPDETQGTAATPRCRADQLGLVAAGWDGATGSLVAAAVVVNVSNARCDLQGAPKVELLDAAGAIIAGAVSGESPGDNVPLPVGEVAFATVIWTNWCSSPPSLPLGMRLALPQEGGALAASIGTPGADNAVSLPRCNAPEAPSGASASAFLPSGLAVVGGPIEDCRADQLTAFIGEWGVAAGTNWATVVVLNYGSAVAPDCRLPTSPVAELRDGAGRVVGQSEASARADSLDLPGIGAAWTSLGFANWCGAPPSEPLSIDLLIGLDRVPVFALAPVPVAGCSGDPGSPAFFGYDAPLALP